MNLDKQSRKLIKRNIRASVTAAAEFAERFPDQIQGQVGNTAKGRFTEIDEATGDEFEIMFDERDRPVSFRLSFLVDGEIDDNTHQHRDVLVDADGRVDHSLGYSELYHLYNPDDGFVGYVGQPRRELVVGYTQLIRAAVEGLLLADAETDQNHTN